MARIVIDPISRIEGHLSIEVEVVGKKVTDAWVSGSLFRGFEIILRGKDPRDAFHITQRICGVCPTPHGHASSMSIEDAANVRIPNNARLARNIIEGAQFVHSHILWFYHLTAVDYVDVISALKAKPKNKEQKAVQDKISQLNKNGQLGPFANGYWGNKAYKLPPDINLLLVAHYVEALDRQAQAANISAILGGIMPMNKATPPGGFTSQPSIENLVHLVNQCQDLKSWVDNTYVQDILTIAPYYLDAAKLGKGHGNYLCWGAFDDKTMNPKKRLFPPGAIFSNNLKVVDPDISKIKEYIEHSWYQGKSKHPSNGETKPNYTNYDTKEKYSWLKAPRLNDKPMEVGPLARVLVAYLSDVKIVKKEVDGVLSSLGAAGQTNILMGVLGRIAARAIETKIIINKMIDWSNDLLKNISSGKNKTFVEFDMPESAEGVGLWGAPRGALGHWSKIRGKKIKNYQCVVPTTWNCSPRDEKGVRGPVEEALIGTPVNDPKQPLEILRVIHSFDPCTACAVHIIDVDKDKIHKFKVG